MEDLIKIIFKDVSIVNKILGLSACEGCVETVKFLGEKGADIHANNDYVLRLSAEKGHLEVVKFLVESGANIHVYNDYALQLSAEKGHIEVVKFLVESGAKIHADNDCALRLSAEEGYFEIVKFLIGSYVNQDIPIPDSIITNELTDINKFLINYIDSDKYDLFHPQIVSSLTNTKSARNI